MKKSDSIGRLYVIIIGFTSHQLCFLKSLFRLPIQGRIIIIPEPMPLVIACLHNTQNDVGHFTTQHWNLRLISQKKKTKPGFSQISYLNAKLSEHDHEMIKKAYDSLNNFWTLKTGKVVENTMKQLALKAKYEHPVHSLIMDPSDQVWEEYFTKEELMEISTFNVKQLPKLPDDLDSYLNAYSNLATPIDIYNKALELKVDITKEKDKVWFQSSILSTATLLENNMLPPIKFSEADIHHRIWSSTYNAFNGCQIKAKIGEMSGDASGTRQNIKRSLATTEKRANRKMGNRNDVIYKYEDYELGCAEIGKDSVTRTENKYMDDGMIKLPKCLKDMLCVLVNEQPEKAHSFVTCGLIIMGMYIEMVVLDNPSGSVSRLSKTPRYKFPSSAQLFPVEMPPVLEIVWIAKQIMLDTVKLLSQKKRKAVYIENNQQSAPIPACFTAERLKKNRY